jgi:hypothetical protein
MKKILLLLFLTTFVISCSKPYSKAQKSEISIVTEPTKFQYEGHVYIIFNFRGDHPYATRSGVVHDPDCHCYNNKQ